jgi:hypothetical protein
VILSELDVVQGRRAIAEEPPVPVTLLVNEVVYQRLGSDAINFVVTNSGTDDLEIPLVKHRPEWVHALENLLQNAKQFAVREVNIHIDWISDDIRIEIRMTARDFRLRFWRRRVSPGIVAAKEPVGIVALVCLLREACSNRLAARCSLAMRLVAAGWLNYGYRVQPCNGCGIWLIGI